MPEIPADYSLSVRRGGGRPRLIAKGIQPPRRPRKTFFMAKKPRDIKPLLRYFVNLFKLQVTGVNHSPAIVRVIPVVEKTNGESIYEFKIRYQSAWKSRRMSIEPLGETVESKSTCYKVVFDDLLVIKIPPRPIKDFTTYLDQVNREHAIAERITKSIPCLYPQLGAILKRIPLIRLPSYVLPGDAEKEYIQLLSKNPGLQEFLTVGEGFVFFMTFSKYRFFNQMIDSLHRASDHTRQEIIKNGPAAISDFMVFESLYGEQNDRVYFDLHAITESHGQSVENILQEAGAPWFVPEAQKKEWLFAHIAGLPPDIDPARLPEGVFERTEKMTRALVEAKKPTIEEFRKIVHNSSKKKVFSGNRGAIRGLVINALKLLYRLKKRSAAIRDLKPDNMYVAAFLDGSDNILENPDAYDLGLIDLETAICFKPSKDGRIEQPLLAGTPSYATPSHIFGNKVLRAVYGDELPRIFYLQDMHASTAILFRLVTGRSLFLKTARLMPEISRLKKKNIDDFQSLMAVFESTGNTFWKMAAAEFSEKMNKYGEWLRDVEIVLPGRLKKFLALEYRHEFRQSTYPHCKHRRMQYRNTMLALDAPVSCYFLIEFMFNRVYAAMHPPEGMKASTGRGPGEKAAAKRFTAAPHREHHPSKLP